MITKGHQGEEIACHYLSSKGFKIVERNFHSRFGEIDIIATDEKTVVFIEVKLRTSHLFGTPLEAITQQKLRKMQKTAYYFLTRNRLTNYSFRFDAIEIDIINDIEQKINHIENITL